MDGAITIDATAFLTVTGALTFAGAGMVAAIGALWRRVGSWMRICTSAWRGCRTDGPYIT